MATKLILFGGLPVLSEGTPVVFTPAPADPVAADVAYTDETVESLADGTITVSNPTGGLGTYQYNIGSGWQSSGSFTALAPGAYVVQIRDAADHDNTVTLATVTIAAGVPEWMTWFVWVETEPVDDPITIEGIAYTHGELVAEDFPDILVKYDNEAPHLVRMVGLLLPELVGMLSQHQLDTLHEVFELWVYWSGTWNDNGVMKANRDIEGEEVNHAFSFIVQSDNTGVNSDTQFKIPASGAGYDYDVYWEDTTDPTNNGTILNQTDAYIIDFGVAGNYLVKITGTFPRFNCSLVNDDRLKIVSVENWGTSVWDTMLNAFTGCSNLVAINATDAPNLSNMTTMWGTFQNCSLFNADLSSWDVSNIQSFEKMFFGATVFNGNITTWNTVSVTSLKETFRDAFAFNQNISGWNVGNVPNFSFMFQGASAFNQNISSWNTSGATNMTSMFQAASVFNQDLSGWDVPLIATEPTSFDLSATAWVLEDSRPVWGTTNFDYTLDPGPVDTISDGVTHDGTRFFVPDGVTSFTFNDNSVGYTATYNSGTETWDIDLT